MPFLTEKRWRGWERGGRGRSAQHPHCPLRQRVYWPLKLCPLLHGGSRPRWQLSPVFEVRLSLLHKCRHPFPPVFLVGKGTKQSWTAARHMSQWVRCGEGGWGGLCGATTWNPGNSLGSLPEQGWPGDRTTTGCVQSSPTHRPSGARTGSSAEGSPELNSTEGLTRQGSRLYLCTLPRVHTHLHFLRSQSHCLSLLSKTPSVTFS